MTSFFGRCAFFAGGVFALVWSTLWKALDWPTWLAVLVVFTGAAGAYWLFDWAARHTEDRVRDRVVAELAAALDGVYVGDLNDPVYGLYRCGKQDGYREAAGTVRHHYDVEEPA